MRGKRKYNWGAGACWATAGHQGPRTFSEDKETVAFIFHGEVTAGISNRWMTVFE